MEREEKKIVTEQKKAGKHVNKQQIQINYY